MDYFPIFTQLKGRLCLVIGAGEVAARKIELLLQSGASIRVVALDIGERVQALAQSSKKITLIKDSYSDQYLNDVQLVISATNDRNLNQHIAEAANKRKLFVNVVDDGELCSFITPAIVDRSPITIAISSGAQAPLLARLIREKIESIIPFAYGKLAQLSHKFRDKVKSTFNNAIDRKNFWEAVFEGEVAEQMFQNQPGKAEQKLKQLLNKYKYTNRPVAGEVYLIGAGPGDADLLTFRALRLMQKADVVIYDRLVSKDVLNLVRRDAERIYVGKEKANHCVPQDQINDLLIKSAKAGKRVVRLKGGDPYIFGRGGEEIQQLVAAGISYQVVPGITSAAGASTYCGIPLTHRDYAQSVILATGHLKDNTVNLNWKALAQKNSTLVIYMGLSSLSIMSTQLIRHGLSKNTPVAVIQNATLPDQKVVTGTLQTIQTEVHRAKIESPAIIIIGDVVKLHQELNQAPSLALAAQY
jgi:uroporphyrin-III C-methyltransferase/precorrin-2 dehydrogenase/sirohydrochlorin ferrochelatase